MVLHQGMELEMDSMLNELALMSLLLLIVFLSGKV